MGIDIEELEKRVNRHEGVLEDVLRERLLQIEMRMGKLESRLDALYEKTERDKTELIERVERRMASSHFQPSTSQPCGLYYLFQENKTPLFFDFFTDLMGTNS